MIILILTKLGLKLVFLKNFASHTHTFYSYFSMLGGVYAQNWVVFQNRVFSKILIDWGCFSINRNCFKNFKEASVCFDRTKVIFDQSKIVIKVFKNKILTCSTQLFQTFFKLFFLSPTWQGFSSNFCRFPLIFLQGFPLPRPVRPFYPSFCIYFHVFVHKFMHFVGIFEPIQIWGFWWFKLSFWNWSLGFVPITLLTWSMIFNLINLMYCEKLKF